MHAKREAFRCRQILQAQQKLTADGCLKRAKRSNFRASFTCVRTSSVRSRSAHTVKSSALGPKAPSGTVHCACRVHDAVVDDASFDAGGGCASDAANSSTCRLASARSV